MFSDFSSPSVFSNGTTGAVDLKYPNQHTFSPIVQSWAIRTALSKTKRGVIHWTYLPTY